MTLKQQLRTLGRARRAEHTHLYQDALASQVQTYLKTLPLQCLGGFWPLEHEPDLSSVYSWWHQQGGLIALPRVANNAMTFHLWTPEILLAAGPFGIQEPIAAAPIITPTYILAPFLWANYDKYRVGYGGGYFDRYVSHARAHGTLKLFIGVGLLCLTGDEAFQEPHDEMMDVMITEQGVR